MKKISFNKITVRNFLSFGPEPTTLEYKNGLTFVTGFNKDYNTYNGVGKTTLLVEAISFALFGEAYRKMDQAEIINENAKGACIVELWMQVNDDSYKITRSLKPNKLYLVKNTEAVPDKDETRTIPQTNADILNIIGISKQIFNNTLVMTNDPKNKFIGQTKENKTKFIEGILSLEAFSAMADQAKKDINEFYKIVDREKILIEEVRSTITNDIRHRDQFDQSTANTHTQLVDERNRLLSIVPVDRSSEITELCKKKLDAEAKIKETEEKVQKVAIKLAGLESTMASYKKELSSFNNIKLDCPTCKRPFGEHDPAVINQEKERVAQDITQLKLEIDKYNSGIQKGNGTINTQKQECATVERTIKELEKEQLCFVQARQKVEEIDIQIQNNNNRFNPFNSKIEEQQERLDQLELDHKQSNTELRLKEAIKFATSTQGVRSVIIKKILDALNMRLAFYLKKLNSPYTCSFNEFFEESICRADGTEVSYYSASGGEARRIDFALLFAFRDIRRMQSNIEINLSVFDEFFDGAICSNVMADIMELLEYMASDTDQSFYVITHRPAAIPDNSTMMYLEKENGITKIIK